MRCVLMEGFVGEKDFKLAAVWNEDPVDVLEDGGHVSMGGGRGDGSWRFGFTDVY